VRPGVGAALLLAGFTSAACADPPEPPPPQTTHVDAGIGVGLVRFPVYTGAAEDRTVVLPFPYFVVHSQYLDVDRNRLRGKLLKDERFSLDVDFGGDVSVTSSDTRERQGMPDLDWVGEVGPALRYHAWRGEDHTGFDLVLPVRVAASVHALDFHHRGYVIGPRLEWHAPIAVQGDQVTWDSALTADFFDRAYADYYYSVAPQYATPSRPSYAASGGYAGWRWELGISWHHSEFVYGAFLERTSLHGAAFQSSPLVGDAGGWSAGLALSWVFHHQ
jgi:outer membrane scaffolding protein for murein synthesis (MipA/OmpV family)